MQIINERMDRLRKDLGMNDWYDSYGRAENIPT